MEKRKELLLWTLSIVVIAVVPILVVSTRTGTGTNTSVMQNNNQHTSTTTRRLLTVVPANKNSSLLTQKTLAYFYEHANDHSGVIIGQYIGGVSEGTEKVNNEYQAYYKQLEEKTGKSPALIGVDYGWEHQPDNYTYINSLLIDHSKKGGLVEVSMSPGNPFTGGGLRDLSWGGISTMR